MKFRPLPVLLAALFVTSCQPSGCGGNPTQPPAAESSAAPTTSPSVAVSTAPVPSAVGVVDGQVLAHKELASHPQTFIGTNVGAFISTNGGTFIGTNTGAFIGTNVGAFIGTNVGAYTVAQAGATLAESPLGGAEVVLAEPDGDKLRVVSGLGSVRTDGNGRFKFNGIPAGRTYVAVALVLNPKTGKGGTLQTLLAPGRAASLSAASTVVTVAAVQKLQRSLSEIRLEVFDSAVESAAKRLRPEAPPDVSARETVLTEYDRVAQEAPTVRTAVEQIQTDAQAAPPAAPAVVASPASGAAPGAESPSATPALPQAGTLSWTFDGAPQVKTCPAIGPDQTLYIGSEAGKVHAITPSGQERWSFEAGGPVSQSPTVGADGTIFAVNNEGAVVALNADGSRKWAAALGRAPRSGPVIGPDDTLYVAGSDGTVLGFEVATGKLSKTLSFASKDGELAFGRDALYAMNSAGELVALNLNGATRWVFPSGGALGGPPAIAADGTAFIGASDGQVYALEAATGRVKWKYDAHSPITTGTVLWLEGTVYAGSQDGKLHAIRWDGTSLWTADLGAAPSGVPALGEDGTVYVGAGKQVVAVSARGQTQWRYATQAAVTGAPNLGGRVLYIAAERLLALHTDSTRLASSPWAKYHKDAANTGR